jgi:triacylglycerol lipase
MLRWPERPAMSDAQVTFSRKLHEAGFDLAGRALDGAPVLLLHGFLATPRALGPLSRRLARDGFRVFSLELGRPINRHRIEALAEQVRDEVERIYEGNPGLGRLVVIGHSQGGLIASWWVKRLGGHRRVRAVVTLGTPFHGTRLAWAGILLAWLMPSLVQMLPGSSFLRRLRETAWPAPVGLVSLYSRRDRIAPWKGAAAESGLASVRSVEVDARHSDYLLKKRIYRTIVGELRRLSIHKARGRSTPIAA